MHIHTVRGRGGISWRKGAEENSTRREIVRQLSLATFHQRQTFKKYKETSAQRMRKKKKEREADKSCA